MQPESGNRYLDQAAINYTPSQFATSYTGSISGIKRNGMNVDDDELSKVSTYTSYTAATDEDGMVRRERGRAFNVLSEVYSLPTDPDEWERLDKQHRAISLGLGGLYPAPDVVRAVLTLQEGVKKRIVDLGCGTGIWSIEMAREFPHCDVLGVDLAPVPLPPESLPPNCRFEMDDISNGITHLHGLFDVVFARAIGLGLKDCRKTLADMEMCAKPGGIVIWIDADFDLYSGWPMVYRPFWANSNPNGSYAQRTLYEVRRSASLRNGDVKTMEKVLDEGFWTHATGLDPTTCKAASLYLPIGTWCDGGDDQDQNDRLRYVGTLMRQQETGNTTQPLLLKLGWSKELTDRWKAGLQDECEKDTLGLRLRISWGRRRAGKDLPAPALPQVTTGSQGNQAQSRYSLYEVYDTQEQAMAAAVIRNKDKNITPPPFASDSIE